MANGKRREREKQELRQRILDAARELFARDGYEAVTMRKIADAIEYSPTALYFHFQDKETLVRELCGEDFLTLAKAFQRIAREPDPVERLRKAGHAYVEFGLSHPNHYRLMFMTPRAHDKDPELVDKGNPEQDAYAFLRGAVGEALQAGRLRDDLKDPEVASQALWSAVHGVVSLIIARGSDPWIDWRPARKTAQLVVDAMLRGLAKEG